ncbi:MAG: hypothetical protein HY234_03930 [Acidobacteria bacterium]|nr:hypothetical protein [Acidobacteriota bacterium]
MTLAIALRGENFVLLAADKRETRLSSTSGNYSTVVQKIEEISNAYYVVAAGPAGSVEMFRSAHGATTWDITSKLAELYAARFQDEASRGQYQMQFIYAQIERQEIQVTKACSPHFFPSSVKSFETIGSGAQSTYFLKHVYEESRKRKRQLTPSDLELLSCFCISETAKQDGFVGDGIDAVLLYEDGRREWVSEQVSKNIQDSERIAAQIADLFIRNR